MKHCNPFLAYEIRHNPTPGAGFRLEIVAVTVRELDREAGNAMVENRVGGYILRHLARFDRLASTPTRAAKIAIEIAKQNRAAAADAGEPLPRRRTDPADVFRFRAPTEAASPAENPPSPNGQENAPVGARLLSAVLQNATR